MPNTREKLIELLAETPGIGWSPSARQMVADHLIANGVTVQKWIPVAERLPEDAGKFLVLKKAKYLNMYITWLGWYHPKEKCFTYYDSELGEVKISDVTHWMPLPELPKGE